MRNWINKSLAMLLALTMLLTCATMGVAETTEAEKADTLVVGYSYFSSKFSEFYSETAYDRDAVDMTQVYLVDSDREGNIIYKGIEGETVPFNGVDHTYTGIADVEVVQNENGTVDYNITLRDDIVFSDGDPMTIDDVIFNMYVYCDPTYVGSSTFDALDIEGLEAYTSGMSALAGLILADGPDATNDAYTAEQAETYWTAFNAAGVKFAQEIIDYVVANYGSMAESTLGCTEDQLAAEPGYQTALGMAVWGYGSAENGVFTAPSGATYDMANGVFPTAADYFNEIVAAYGYDLSDDGINKETAGSSIAGLIDAELGDKAESYAAGVATGDAAPSITGIIKTGDYAMTLRLNSFDVTAIYSLSFAVSPMHYYGDATLYDYDNNMFGFPKGDLSGVKAKTTKPLGAGAYKFVSYENGIITYEANELYFKGCPKIPHILFQETTDADKLTGIATGSFDVTDPSFSTVTVEGIKGYNGNGELTGEMITTNTVDNLGYGYIGLSAANMKVGTDIGSAESKALRKGFATLMAVYRDTVMNSYYGDRAAVIQYPISNTSWAAPRSADEGYQIAFSTDVDGNPIYTDTMTEQEKFDAALQAAIGYFKFAGFTWDDATSTFTAAPEGAKMSYEAIIPADGIGDHPSYGVLTATKDALATIGITLEINDPADSNVLWNTLNAGNGEIWAAAWQATPDPDMKQIYHSENVIGGGGTEDNRYNIMDSKLDELIEVAVTSSDRDFRKATYTEALNIILDWAVELPVYQRLNAVIFSTERVNMDTVTPDITTFWKWMKDIELLEMN